MISDLRRHLRFLLSFAIGLALGLAPTGCKTIDRVLIFRSASTCALRSCRR